MKTATVQSGKNKGKETVIPVSHHTTLTHAINGLIRHAMQESKATDFAMLTVDAHKMVTDIKNAIGGKFELRYIEAI